MVLAVILTGPEGDCSVIAAPLVVMVLDVSSTAGPETETWPAPVGPAPVESNAVSKLTSPPVDENVALPPPVSIWLCDVFTAYQLEPWPLTVRSLPFVVIVEEPI
jgi:hypothetical protein